MHKDWYISGTSFSFSYLCQVAGRHSTLPLGGSISYHSILPTVYIVSDFSAVQI